MRTIIVDDKPGPKRTLKTLLNKYFPEIEIVAEANNVKQGVNVITELSPQLVFLDVEMPDGTGFDLLEQINPIDFKVIFTTGFEKYAIKAFKFSAIDYLLKPVDSEDLKVAVCKAKEEIKNEILQLKVGTLLNNLSEVSDNLKKIVLKDSSSIHVVQINEILYLEADSNYTKFYLTENRQILVSETLKEYENLLQKAGFFRCHKSFLMNLSMLKRFDKRDGGIIILQDDKSVPLSSRKKDKFLALLEIM